MPPQASWIAPGQITIIALLPATTCDASLMPTDRCLVAPGGALPYTHPEDGGRSICVYKTGGEYMHRSDTRVRSGD